MKKQYTRKQITEAIKYWEKQLRKGNYRKVNESSQSSPTAEPDIIGELPNRDDIPNYVKDYLNEWDREGGTWNLPRGWSLDKLVADIKRVRKIKVTTYTGKSGPGIDIPTNAVPLKVTPRQIEDYVQRVQPGAKILTVTIDFGVDFRPSDDYAVGIGGIVYSPGASVEDDPEWCEDVYSEYPPIQPVDMGEDGDATLFWSDLGNYTVDDAGFMNR